MRIIGNVEHPHLKITIFKTGERVSVKFENAHYEQTFKLGDDERLGDAGLVSQLVDSQMIGSVLATFQQMHQTRMAAMGRAFPVAVEHVFEEII
jgi:hypothetical protein